MNAPQMLGWRIWTRKQVELQPLFEQTYGADARHLVATLADFFMACAELFGYEHGREWVIGHFLLKKENRIIEWQIGWASGECTNVKAASGTNTIILFG